MGRIIEVASNHRHLRAERGFLVIDKPSKRLWDLAGKVKSGDPTNIEGQAARLFGYVR